MIELTTAEARTGDALKVKGAIINGVKEWHKLVTDNPWLFKEWDEEFGDYIRKVTDPVAGSIIVKQ